MMIKRTFVMGLVAVGFAAAAVAAQPPNILLILADDMGYSDLGCMGSEINTPNLDRLSNKGILFTQAYNTAKCYPSRACLVNGVYYQQTDDQWNDTTTLGEMLKPAGYNTFWSGKHHAGFDPRTRGFDRFYGFLGGAINFWNPGDTAVPGGKQPAYIGAYKWVLDEPGIVKSFVPDRADWYSTDVFTDKGVQWLEETKDDDKPFLLYMAYNAPHWPLQAPQKHIDRCKGRYDAGYDAIRNARYQRQIELGVVDPEVAKLSEPEYDQPWEELSPKQRERRIEQMEVYAAMIENMDDNIGRLLDLLQKQGRLDNTLVLFLADNGACAETPTKRVKNYSDEVPIGGVESYESYGQGWAAVGNTPLRKFKQQSHEGGIGTAMIAHWPKGLAAPGRINRDRVHLIDIMPTIAALSGAKTPGNAQGISIVPALQNKPLKRDKDMYWEFGSGQAIRRGDMKLVTKNQKPWELYNLAIDRSETRNLASQMPELVQELSTSWNTWWMECTGSPYTGKKKKVKD
ncbi:arylsulfatase [Pontiella sulfatireligans]|uniref:Arylsulfatase n=1 Tax=Pontiella sulfatireligans TaxID=2750658 RepID=A0A6C2UKR3_9BACT|nr:arylsulfatase [Pontiella sulfatireligans]SPS74438.1 sulfatase S1_4 [Kiritimatiellales bacterium]VGO20698.1 Arylsulfatase [Pontiella sulfatireligans]